MAVYRQPSLTWRVKFPRRTEDGETQWVTEEGFPSKLEAIQWQNDSLPKKSGSIDMSFRDFAKGYCEDMAPHFRGKTLAAKENIINTLLLPYLGEIRLCDLSPRHILELQQEIRGQVSKSDFSAVRSLLIGMLDFAGRVYGLTKNPARLVGGGFSMIEGKSKSLAEEEYRKFADAIKDEQTAHCCREILTWSGIRAEELLALTLADVNLKGQTITVSKVFQTVNVEDVNAEPDPLKAKRKVKIPNFLCAELRDYVQMQPGLKPREMLGTVLEASGL